MICTSRLEVTLPTWAICSSKAMVSVFLEPAFQSNVEFEYEFLVLTLGLLLDSLTLANICKVCVIFHDQEVGHPRLNVPFQKGKMTNYD